MELKSYTPSASELSDCDFVMQLAVGVRPSDTATIKNLYIFQECFGKKNLNQKRQYDEECDT